MAKRIGKYKVSKKESALSLADGGTVTGNLVVGADAQLQITNPVSGSTSAATTITKATHGGRITYLGATEGSDLTHLLPTPEVGLTFEFVYSGDGASGNDHIFDGQESEFLGNIIHNDSNADDVAVNCNGTDEDVLNFQVPTAFTVKFVGISTSLWLVSGHAVGNTPPTCTDG